MDHCEIETIVLTVLAAALKCEVAPDSSRRNIPKWDSLKHIEIIFAVEDELDIQFSEEELARLDSVASITDLALTRHAA